MPLRYSPQPIHSLMKAISFPFFAFASLIVSLFAFGSCERKQPDEAKEATQAPFERYDKDQDGLLSDSERTEMNETFVERFDTDGDGKLGPKERQDARNQSQITVSVARKTLETEQSADGLINRLDKNSDGSITIDEVDETRWKVISRADKDGDGRVTKAEWLLRGQ